MTAGSGEWQIELTSKWAVAIELKRDSEARDKATHPSEDDDDDEKRKARCVSAQGHPGSAMSSQHHWGYSAEDGPQKWPKLFGAGKFQSPINIQVGERLRLTCCAGQPLASQQLKQGRHHLDSQGEEAHRRSPSANSRASTDTSTDSELFERRTGSAGSFSASLDSDLGSSPCSPSPVAPLDKQHQQTRFVVSKRKLFLGYPRYLHSMQLCNTGHGWQVDLPAELAEHTRE